VTVERGGGNASVARVTLCDAKDMNRDDGKCPLRMNVSVPGSDANAANVSWMKRM